MGSSRPPVVFSNTFVSCPHGREEVGLAVPSPGGPFLPSTYGCECDWPALKDVRWPSCMSELNLPYTDEETGPVERIRGLHAHGS